MCHGDRRSTRGAWASGTTEEPRSGGEGRMTARRLDGTALAATLRAEAAPKVSEFIARWGRAPSLAVVLAGDNPASEIYVRHKLKAVGDAGCRAELFRLDAASTLDDALALVDRLNTD